MDLPDSAATRDEMIVLFRNQSSAKDVEIRLPVPPGAEFRAKSVITDQSLGQLHSDDLARGRNVKFPPGHAVEIIELDRGTRPLAEAEHDAHR